MLIPPKSAQYIEVGTRDGLQNTQYVIPTIQNPILSILSNSYNKYKLKQVLIFKKDSKSLNILNLFFE